MRHTVHDEPHEQNSLGIPELNTSGTSMAFYVTVAPFISARTYLTYLFCTVTWWFWLYESLHRVAARPTFARKSQCPNVLRFCPASCRDACRDASCPALSVSPSRAPRNISDISFSSCKTVPKHVMCRQTKIEKILGTSHTPVQNLPTVGRGSPSAPSAVDPHAVGTRAVSLCWVCDAATVVWSFAVATHDTEQFR